VEELEPVVQLVVEGVLLQPAVQEVRPGRPPLFQASGSRRRGSEYEVNSLKIQQNIQLLSYSVHMKKDSKGNMFGFIYIYSMYISVFSDLIDSGFVPLMSRLILNGNRLAICKAKLKMNSASS
jgi:hypothetical protein